MSKIPIYLIATFIFNTAIAGVLTLFMPIFWINFVFSQCIGLSVMSINGLIIVFMKPGIMRWAAISVALPCSVALGMTLAFMGLGAGMSGWNDKSVLSTMMIGLFFGLIGATAFLLYERADAEIKQRKLIKDESEKREIEAHLKLLQAQIEPHFLFNTLANVSSLIDSDPAVAKKLLERLNDWLRVALVRARSDKAALDDELDMLENYLQILKIRFGERLRWQINVPKEAREIPFPPMLLQPLVENAVRHGIEPKIGGGEIGIRAYIKDATLHIEVSDSGVGLIGNEAGGAGLSNVRARLTALFGDAGQLVLENKNGGGVSATLELPI